jgi:hypothetical protein
MSKPPSCWRKRNKEETKDSRRKRSTLPSRDKIHRFLLQPGRKNDEKFLAPEKMKEEGKQNSGCITGRDVATLVN